MVAAHAAPCVPFPPGCVWVLLLGPWIRLLSDESERREAVHCIAAFQGAARVSDCRFEMAERAGGGDCLVYSFLWVHSKGL